MMIVVYIYITRHYFGFQCVHNIYRIKVEVYKNKNTTQYTQTFSNSYISVYIVTDKKKNVIDMI